MTYKTRLLALLLALVMVLGALAGCAEGVGGITESESESESVVETGSGEGTNTEATETEPVGTSDTEAATTTEAITEESQETSTDEATEAPTESTEEATTEPKEPDTGWETLADLTREQEECAASTGHSMLTDWMPKAGTAREYKYCYFCGYTNMDTSNSTFNRATPIVIYAINIEQSKYQTAIRSDRASGQMTFKVPAGAKVVIPTTPEYNIVASNIGLDMTGNYDQTIVGDAVYYSVDGGETWALCPSEKGVLTIALTSEMFTGENAGNVEKALEYGVYYGVIPGYNAEYFAEHPDSLKKIMRKIAYIDKADLSDNVEDSAGYKDDLTLAVTECGHNGKRTVESATEGDYTTYTYKCETCNKVLGTSQKVKSGINFSTKLISDADIVGVQNGVVFARVRPTGKEKIEITPLSGGMTLGKYAVVKYRAMGYGSLKVTWSLEGATKPTQTISRAETDGWITAVVDLAGMHAAANLAYEVGTKGNFSIIMECEGVVDIAYVATVATIEDAHSLMNEGEFYYNRGTSFSKVGALCGQDGKCLIHSTKVTKTDTEDKKATTYSYDCDVCGEKIAEDITVSKSVTFFATVTQLTAQDNNANTKVSYTGDGKVAYARSEHVAGEYASLLFANATVELGKYMVIKYRVIGDGYVRMDSYLGGSSGRNDSGSNSNHPRDEWMVAVIDISGFKGYKDKTSFFAVLQHTCTLDVAYVAVANNIEDIRSLLADDEHYYVRGGGNKAFHNFADQAEVDKSGKCVGEHKPVVIPAIPETCTNVGYTEGSACLGCGEIYVARTEIPANPEKHVVIEIPAVEENCTTAGSTLGSKCSECGQIFVAPQIIPANEKKHVVSVTIMTGEGQTTYSFSCKMCGKKIANDIVVSDKVTFFTDITKIGPQEKESGTKVTYKVEDGIAFARAEFVGTTGYASTLLANATYKLGKYMVIKYRVIGDGYVRFLNYLGGSTGFNDSGSNSDHPRDKWMVAVIDISDFKGYKGMTSLFSVFHHTCTIDIAYIAISDDITAIRDLLVDNENYYVRGGGAKAFHNISGQAEVNKLGKCVGEHTIVIYPAVSETCTSVGYTEGSACMGCGEVFKVQQTIPVDPDKHNASITTSTKDGMITYTYICRDCKTELRQPLTVPATLAYIDGSALAAGNGQIIGIADRVENGVVYKHIVSKNNEGYSEVTIKGVTLGRYVAVKYRVTDAANGGSIYLQLFHSSYTSIHKGNIANAQTDGWVVAVIDLVNKSQYNALKNSDKTTDLSFTLRVGNGATVDVAYMVMSDDMSAIRSFLGENETYFFRGDNFQDVPGDELNKNGLCAGEHTFTTIPTLDATCVSAGHEGGIHCSVCGLITEEPTTIPAHGIHTVEYIPVVPATCNKVGYTAGTKCSVCDHVFVAPVEIPATGKHLEVLIPAVEATCTTPGSTAGTKCAECGEVINAPQEIAVDTTKHVIVEIAAIPATCTAVGYSAGSKCSKCGEVFQEPHEQPIDPDNHHISIVKETVNGGVKYTYTCTECSVANTRVITDNIKYFADLAVFEYWDGTKTSYANIQYKEGIYYTTSAYNNGQTLQTTVSNKAVNTTIGKYLVVKYRIHDEYNGYLKMFLQINGGVQQEPVIQAKDVPVRGEWTVAVIDISALNVAPTKGEPRIWIRFQHFDTLDVAYVAMATDMTDIAELLGEEEHYFYRGASFDNVADQVEMDKTAHCVGKHTETAMEEIPASCGKEGSKGGSICSVCGTVTKEPETVPAITEHNFVEIPYVAPTCTTPGHTGGIHCSICGLVKEESTPIDVIEHTEVDIPAVAATCTTPGSEGGKMCSVCETITKEPTATDIDPDNHLEDKIVIIEAIPATCCEDGYTEGKRCSDCGKILDEPQKVESAPDKHVVVEIDAITATCCKAGSTAGSYCSRCGEFIEKPELIPANPDNHSVSVTTFTKDGMITYKYNCKNCHREVRASITVPATLAYIDGSALAAGNGQIIGIANRVENGVVYKHIVAQSNLGYSEVTIEGATLGRYVAVKYRVTDANNGGSVYLQLYHGSYKSIHKGEISNAQTDGWVVAVIDLVNKSQYNALKNAGTTTGLSFTLRVGNGATIDVAYMVMSDDMSVIRSFLEDGETYFDRDESFATVPGDELDKNGICVGKHKFTTIPTLPATCVSAGHEGGVHCSVCGFVKEEPTTIPAHGNHTIEEIPAIPETCQTPGMTAGTRCAVCHKVFVEPQEIPANPEKHTAVVIPAVAGNCQTPGYTAGTKCSICDKILVEPQIVEGVGAHVEVAIPAVQATCTTPGYSEGVKCKLCDTVIVAPTSIDATGHTPVAIPDVAPTCTIPGHTGGTMCSVCEEVLDPFTVQEATGNHTEVPIDAVAPTCTTPGSEGGMKCSVCGTVTVEPTEIPIDPTKHPEDKKVAIESVAPTCTTPGSEGGERCSDCGAITVEPTVIPPIGTEHTNVVDIPAVEATCTAVGYTEGSRCEDCGAIIVAPTEIPIDPTNHVGEEVKVEAIAATCTTVGYTEGSKCTACDKFIDQPERIELDPNNHHKPVAIPDVEPTCCDNGSKGGTKCSSCGVVITPSEVIDKDPDKHNIVEIPAGNGNCVTAGSTGGSICTICGTFIGEPPTVIPVNPDKHINVTITKTEKNDKLVYTYVCSDCNKTLHVVTIDKTLAYIDGSAFVNNGTNPNIQSRVEMFEGGFAYQSISARPGQTGSSVGTVNGVTLGRYVAVKYRVTGTGNTAFSIGYLNKEDKGVTFHSGTLEQKATDGWIVAVVDISGKSNYKPLVAAQDLVDKTLQFFISSGATVDIAYVVMSDDMNVIRGFLADNETYFDRKDNLQTNNPGTELDKNGNCAHKGGVATCLSQAICEQCQQPYGEIGTHNVVEIPATSGTCGVPGYTAGSKCKWCGEIYVEQQEGEIDPDNHVVKMQKTVNEGGTVTYTYACDCGHVKHNSVTLPSSVFNADITGITSTGTVTTNVDADNKLYTSVAANGQEVTTEIRVSNVTAAMALFMKYRLNGGATPQSGITVTITYVVGGKTYTNSATVDASVLQTYHEGWVVGRVNMKSYFPKENFYTAIQNTSYAYTTLTAESITITIKHSEDLDIEFLYGDNYEDNSNVFPAMYEMGDKYYLVQTVFGNHSGTDRWRSVPATGTSAATIKDTALDGYKTPYLRDALHEHTGGTPTCKSQAICTICGKGYGELGSHVGGTATCQAQAVCTACGVSYGELGDHAGNEATCGSQAVCATCGTVLGEINPNNHAVKMQKTTNEDGTITYTYACDCGGKTVWSKTFNSNVYAVSDWTSNSFSVTDGTTEVKDETDAMYGDLAYVRVTPDEGKAATTTFKIDSKIGKYVYIMYRVADSASGRTPTGNLVFNYGWNGTSVASNAELANATLKNAALDGWVLTSVNLQGKSGVNLGQDGTFTISLTHTDVLDIAFVIIGNDNDSIRLQLVETGGHYWFQSSYFNQWSAGNKRTLLADGTWKNG